ncbi:unnamed protein product [Meganyctiphanes norvegica]|uniref:Uncharacterized protein n=1 Tax=Meganyctiphanes norvegica TaxID=48144 RepID=A0AAV2RZN5_MEGNR
MDDSVSSLSWFNWLLWAVGAILVLYKSSLFLWEVLEAFRIHFLSRFQDKKLTQTYGEWAVVTGGSDGIGKGYARELAKGGMKVILVAWNKDELNNVAREISTEFGVETSIVVVDFSQGQTIYRHIAKELEGKDIGILVNNVGTVGPATPTPFSEVTESEFWGIVNINVGSVPAMTKIVLPGMLKRGRGAIVNMGSIASWKSIPYLQTYSASKAFIDFFTQALAEEVRGTGVIVQGVHPGMVDTNMAKGYVKLKYDGKGIPEILFPKVSTYCPSAFATLGKTEYTNGYWGHGLMMYILALIPTSILTKMQTEENKKLYKKSLKVQKQN